MAVFMTKDDLGQMSLEWFQEIGYTFVHGPSLAPGSDSPERGDLRQVVLTGRLREALKRLCSQVEPRRYLELLSFNGRFDANPRPRNEALFRTWVVGTGEPVALTRSRKLPLAGSHSIGFRLITAKRVAEVVA